MIFIDTGAWLGWYVPSDQYHVPAWHGWRRIVNEHLPCMTSNLVLAEMFNLLARRAGYTFAAETATNIYGSGHVEILRAEKEDDLAALAYLRKYADQKVSFTDCVSFVLMKKLSITQAFSFDRHFETAGFTLWN